MSPEAIPFYEEGTRPTGHCEAAVTGKRFVAISDDIQGTGSPGLTDAVTGGNIVISPCAAGAKAFGVASWDGAIGAKVTVLRAPLIVPVTAQGAINAGAEVEVGTNGRALTIGAGIAAGVCLNTVADGEDAMIALYL